LFQGKSQPWLEGQNNANKLEEKCKKAHEPNV
jgi:hypothetical protein